MSNYDVITDDKTNGGLELIDLEQSLRNINKKLEKLSSSDTTNNLYTSDAIGLMVYETEYVKTQELNSVNDETNKSYEEDLVQAKTELDAYFNKALNPYMIDYAYDYIQETGCTNANVWNILNEKFVDSSSTMSGKLLKTGKVVDTKFLLAVEKYSEAYREVESRKGHLVGIYKNDGEQIGNSQGDDTVPLYASLPKNLIEVAYVSKLDFYANDTVKNDMADLLVSGTVSKNIENIADCLSSPAKKLLGNVIASVVNLGNLVKYTGADVDEIYTEQSRILNKNLNDLYGTANLSGLSTENLK